MSLKNTKNLVIIAAVVVAVLAGTVLLGNYTNILSSGSKADSQPKACQAKTSSCCPAANAMFAENTEMMGVQTAEVGAVAKTCPMDGTKACCAESGSCPKTDCPPDCTKPCCAGEAAPDCCPKSDTSAAATGGCPVASTTTE
jgi:hypothetical protein